MRLMRPIFLLVAYALSMPLWGCATQHPRVAMLVGNAEYQHAPPLAHPGNDARELGRHFEALGWSVSTAIDLPDEDLASALDVFEDDEMPTTIFTDVVDSCDITVIQASCALSFILKAAQSICRLLMLR